MRISLYIFLFCEAAPHTFLGKKKRL